MIINVQIHYKLLLDATLKPAGVAVPAHEARLNGLFNHQSSASWQRQVRLALLAGEVSAALEVPLFCVEIKLLCKKVDSRIIRISVIKHKAANLYIIDAKLKNYSSNSCCYLLATMHACKLWESD